MIQEIDELRELNRKLGMIAERNRVAKIARKIACSNEIGEYVYLNDLFEYMDDPTEPGDE